MINLTSLTLSHTPVPMGRLLDFFEGAPNLLDVVVMDYNPDPSDEHERLVSLAHLRTLHIYGRDRIFPLLEHLLIPVGATVATDLHTHEIWEHHSAKSIKNLRNFSNFTAISLFLGEYGGSYKFTGPNGEVAVRFVGIPRPNAKVARSLAQLDASQTERLKISYSDPLSEDLRQVLLSMRNLRRLTLYLCQDLCSFLLALNPETHPTNPTLFPKLESLYLRVCDDKDLDFGNVVEVAAARASRGVPFKSVKITKGWGTIPREGEIELRKHVSRVKTVTGIGIDSDDDEED